MWHVALFRQVINIESSVIANATCCLSVRRRDVTRHAPAGELTLRLSRAVTRVHYIVLRSFHVPLEICNETTHCWEHNLIRYWYYEITDRKKMRNFNILWVIIRMRVWNRAWIGVGGRRRTGIRTAYDVVVRDGRLVVGLLVQREVLHGVARRLGLERGLGRGLGRGGRGRRGPAPRLLAAPRRAGRARAAAGRAAVPDLRSATCTRLLGVTYTLFARLLNKSTMDIWKLLTCFAVIHCECWHLLVL